MAGHHPIDRRPDEGRKPELRPSLRDLACGAAGAGRMATRGDDDDGAGHPGQHEQHAAPPAAHTPDRGAPAHAPTPPSSAAVGPPGPPMEFDIVVRRAASPPDDDEDPEEREMTVADYVRAGESCAPPS